MEQKKNILWFLVRLWLGSVFTYSAFLKLVEPSANFQGILTEYGIFPSFLIVPVAFAFPWIEVFIGVFLILGYYPKWSALASFVLSFSFLFLFFITYVKVGTFPEHCGCFGDGGLHLKVWQVMILDVVHCFWGIMLFRRKEHFLSIYS